uniref:MHD1 domain-containing protein n=1 Tax=Kalanchoe fedtschenkoi TaxID=63787 RepID=A0A7N0TVK8_KALFE
MEASSSSCSNTNVSLSSSLLQLYRSDRRKLLDFVLCTSGSIPRSHGPEAPLSDDVDVDRLSVDSVIDCIKAGAKVDLSDNEYYAPSHFPLMMPSRLGDSYFLFSNPNQAGSPPRRVPPPVQVDRASSSASYSSSYQGFTFLKNTAAAKNFVEQKADFSAPLNTIPVKIPAIGLPFLRSGLSDDDLREVSYEVLLASIADSGTDIQPVDDLTKDKMPKFLGRLKSKKERVHSGLQTHGRSLGLINTVRVQMQISVGLDACIRKRLKHYSTRASGRQPSIPHIVVHLLSGISRSDFLNEKAYMQWKSRKANLLKEVFYFSSDHVLSDSSDIGSSISNILSDNDWDIIKTPNERSELLSAIIKLDLKISSKPARFGISCETYFWTASYHINLRLYIRLLYSVFDILDEAQILMEVEEILQLIKVTWPVLGITDKIHSALFGWVLFLQFIETDKSELLEYALLELRKVLTTEDRDVNERLYINSLLCSKVFNNVDLKLNLVHAILFSVGIWCNEKLQDYHLHFSQNPLIFRAVMNLASTVGLLNINNCFELELPNSNCSDEGAFRKVKLYVERSIMSAFERAKKMANCGFKAQPTHPLAMLAKEVKLIADMESEVFSPVLSQWYSAAGVLSALHLHQLYGEELKPFLKEVSCLTEDVILVLPVANMLESQLYAFYSSLAKEIRSHHPFEENMYFYQIELICTPLVLDWVIAQRVHVLEWTARAFELENWEPLSHQQKQAPSIVEVFRIIEESVDQLFKMNLPVDITHLQALISVIYHSLDEYIRKIVDQLVDKRYLRPVIPPLTRYEESVIPMTKKKLVECDLMAPDVKKKLDILTISKLCTRLNTLQYIHKQLNALEANLKDYWSLAQPFSDRHCRNDIDEAQSHSSDSTEALFAVAFDSIKDAANDAISKICDFTGARAIFWDLREMFLFRLYYLNVEGARLENVLTHFDIILDQVCGLLDDTLRDRVVLNIFRASMVCL